ESLSSTQYRMPCLGSIPVVGWLFKSMGKSNDETNLFVFLTPHVVHSVEDAKNVSEEKEEHMGDKIKEGKIKLYDGKKYPFLPKELTEEQPNKE
ncbi:MAG: hypothetical protein R6V39_00700, partial [Desulfovibrionales bacterium]